MDVIKCEHIMNLCCIFLPSNS